MFRAARPGRTTASRACEKRTMSYIKSRFSTRASAGDSPQALAQSAARTHATAGGRAGMHAAPHRSEQVGASVLSRGVRTQCTKQPPSTDHGAAASLLCIILQCIVPSQIATLHCTTATRNRTKSNEARSNQTRRSQTTMQCGHVQGQPGTPMKVRPAGACAQTAEQPRRSRRQRRRPGKQSRQGERV